MTIQKENKVLREQTKKIENFNSPELQSLIKKMSEAMFGEPDGIGIAAPQIGESKKIFLIAEDVLQPQKLEERIKSKESKNKNYFVFINPVFKKRSSKKAVDIEGCLSVRGVYGEVTRSEKVTIEYFNESGIKKTRFFKQKC